MPAEMASAVASEMPGGRDLLDQLRTSVAADLKLLAMLHDKEPEAKTLAALREEGLAQSLGLRLETAAGRAALDIFDQAVAALPDTPGDDVLDRLAVEYGEIYLTHGYRASPYESVWLDEDGLERQQPMFEVRAWYRRHGVCVQDWASRADDHLVLQLQFVGRLLTDGRDLQAVRDAAAFLDQHLLLWIDAFAERVMARCEMPFYAGLAGTTAAYLHRARELFALALDQPKPNYEQLRANKRFSKDCGELGPTYLPGTAPSW